MNKRILAIALSFLFLSFLISCSALKKRADKGGSQRLNKFEKEGKKYLDEGNLDKAIDSFNKSLEINKDNSNSYNGRGNAYMQKHDFQKALDDFDKSDKLLSKQTYSKINRAGALLELKRYDEAMAAYNKALKMKHKKPYEVYYGIARIYNKQRNWNKAVEYINKAINSAPKPDYAYYNFRSQIYLEMGKPDEAEKDSMKALEVDKMGMNSYVLLASIYSDRGELDNGIKMMDEAITRIPDSHYTKKDLFPIKKDQMYYSRGFLHFEKGQYDMAIKDMNSALKINPKFIDIILERAEIHRAKGDMENAKADARDWYKKASPPKQSQDFERFGTAYGILGEQDKAQESFKRALELDPNNYGVYLSRAYFYLENDKKELARNDLKKVIEIGREFDIIEAEKLLKKIGD